MAGKESERQFVRLPGVQFAKARLIEAAYAYADTVLCEGRSSSEAQQSLNELGRLAEHLRETNGCPLKVDKDGKIHIDEDDDVKLFFAKQAERGRRKVRRRVTRDKAVHLMQQAKSGE